MHKFNSKRHERFVKDLDKLEWSKTETRMEQTKNRLTYYSTAEARLRVVGPLGDRGRLIVPCHPAPGASIQQLTQTC